MALTLRERVEKRLLGMKAARLPYEDEWKEISRYAQPSRSRFLQSEANRQFKRSNKAVYNAHGILAFRTLAGGMTSGLSSPSRPWFRLTSFDDDLAQSQDVKEWLAEVEKRMYAFLAGTNFYGAVRTNYAELGLFGTAATVMTEHDEAGAVCHPLTAGEYWIACGDKAEPDTLYRRAPMTVAQTVASFDWSMISPRVRDMYDRAQYEQIVNVMHAIEPNDDRDATKIDNHNKPWRSFYWDADDGDKLNGMLRLSGMEEQPFWAPRWETCGGDSYGTCPGHDSLPDMRELQLQTKRKTEATGFMVKPEKIAPASVKLTGQAGNVVSASASDAQKVEVPYELPYQVGEIIMQDMARCQQSVDSLTYADLFMAITNMQGVQPRNMDEIASRNEEKMSQLGPVIERVNTEMLEVAIDRTFGIMQRKQMLPQAPEQFQGHPIKVDFVSVLAQMQRMVGLGQLEKTVSMIISLAGANPEALDKLNIDATIDEYADRTGSPPKILHSDKDVEAVRAARAQQQQMAQIASLMPAAKAGTEAMQNVAGMQSSAA